MIKPATPKQIDFLVSLVSEVKNLPAEQCSHVRAWAEKATMHAVSEQITAYISQRDALRKVGPARRGYSPQERVGEGFYSLDGDVYRVSAGVYNDGRPYAKVLDRDSGTWVRAQGAMRRLLPEHALTRESAAEWGALTGRCARCGRELEDALSVERGVGPVCWTRF